MYNDIIEMLRQGRSADDLAREFADALNSANKTFQEEEEAKAKTEHSKEIQIADTMELLDDVSWYLNKYYPALSSEKMATRDDAETTIAVLETFANPQPSIFGNFFKDFKF
jgi:hypothetical protein